MNITIISSTSGSKTISDYENSFLLKLKDFGHQLTVFNLKKLSINSCTGCWSCWVKTPGQCIFNDDMHSILKVIINSELVIYLAEPVLGYVNSRLKMVMDRSIPVVHPYIELVNNECHHQKRYEKYPYIGLILEDNNKLCSEDLDIIKYLFQRFSLNFKSRLSIFNTTGSPIQELINEINNM